MTTYYTGNLRTKKKGELQDIAASLGIINSDLLKLELESIIRTTILDNPSLQHDSRFSGLYRAMEVNGGAPTSGRKSFGDQRRSLSSRDSLEDLLNSSPQRPMNGPLGRTRSESAQSVIARDDRHNEYVRASSPVASARPNLRLVPPNYSRTVGRVIAAARTEGARVDQLVRRGSRRVSRQVVGTVEQAKETAVDTMIEAQHVLSSPWVLQGILIFIELSFVLLSVIPLETNRIGPFKWYTYQFTPTSPFNLNIPNLSVLATSEFIQPFLHYITVNVLLPLIAASFISLGNYHTDIPQGRLRPANPMTFGVARMADVVLMQQPFMGASTGYLYGWELGMFGSGGVGGVGMLGGGSTGFANLQILTAIIGILCTL